MNFTPEGYRGLLRNLKNTDTMLAIKALRNLTKKQ